MKVESLCCTEFVGMKNPAICGPISFTAAHWRGETKESSGQHINLNGSPVLQSSTSTGGIRNQLTLKACKSKGVSEVRGHSAVQLRLPNEWLPPFNQSHFIPHNHMDMPSNRGQSARSAFCFTTMNKLVLGLYQCSVLMLYLLCSPADEC